MQMSKKWKSPTKRWSAQNNHSNPSALCHICAKLHTFLLYLQAERGEGPRIKKSANRMSTF